MTKFSQFLGAWIGWSIGNIISYHMELESFNGLVDSIGESGFLLLACYVIAISTKSSNEN